MIQLPPEILKSSHVSRYYKAWQSNEGSILFVPLAEILRNSGYLKEAYQICEQGLKFHPQLISGRLILARIFLDQKQKEKARRLLEEILNDFPDHQEAQNRLDELSPPKKSSPPSLWETCTMAEILNNQGEKKEAVRIIEKILVCHPDNLRAKKLKETLCQEKSLSSMART